MEFIMKLSDNNQISRISYNSNLIAISKDKILNIYELNNEYRFIGNFSFNYKINYIKWSSNSCFLVIGFEKQNFYEIRDLDDNKWVGKITNNNNEKVIYLTISPDNKNIMILYDDFKLKIINILGNKPIKIFYCVKLLFNNTKSFLFNQNKKLCAIPFSEKEFDFINIYLSLDFKKIISIKIENSRNNKLFDFYLTKDDKKIIVINTKLKIFIYNILGNIEKEFEYDHMHINLYKISSDKNFICFTNCKDIFIYNIKEKISYNFTDDLVFYNKKKENNIKIYEEIETKNNNIFKNKKIEFNMIEFSFDSKFIAINENNNNSIFIYNINYRNIYSILNFKNKVKKFKWSPENYILIIITETLDNIYRYNLDILDYIKIPENITLYNNFKFSYDGNFILFNEDNNKFFLIKLKNIINNNNNIN
jgi:hypothetical protein